jgi:hypothetical protein
MAVNKCNTCFYAKMDKELEAPCVTCTGYSNWVPSDMYTSDSTDEDFWFVTDTTKYDTVSKPKHYMLFEEQGIEVRDVIEKLVSKIAVQTGRGELLYFPLAEADYVQMMQYLMRFMDKNGVEDLRKAKWYLDKLIEAYDESDL